MSLTGRGAAVIIMANVAGGADVGVDDSVVSSGVFFVVVVAVVIIVIIVVIVAVFNRRSCSYTGEEVSMRRLCRGYRSRSIRASIVVGR